MKDKDIYELFYLALANFCFVMSLVINGWNGLIINIFGWFWFFLVLYKNGKKK